MKNFRRGISQVERQGPLMGVTRWLLGGQPDSSFQLSQVRLLLHFSLAGIVLAGGYSLYYLLVLKLPAISWVLALAGAGVAVAPFVLRWTRSMMIPAHILIASLMVAAVGISWFRNGLFVASLMYLAPIPLVALYLLGRRAALVWSVIACTVILIVYAACVYGLLRGPISLPTDNLTFASGLACLIFLIHILAATHERAREQAVLEQKQAELRLRESQKLDSIGRLAGGVAHDFNNLLTIIIGISSCARDDEECPPKLRAELEDVITAGQRGAELTRQLLWFSRKHSSAAMVFDLNEALGQAIKLLQRTIREDIEIELHTSDQPLPIKLEPSQLENLVINIASNSQDSMSGGGQIVIRTRALSLTEDGAAELHAPMPSGEFALLQITDDGAGMPDHVASRAFEPFFTTKPTGRGTGLGLASVYGTVKSAGGHIWVDSEEGTGTSVSISFPLSSMSTMPITISAAHEPAAPAHTDARILLAEDDPHLRAATESILNASGHRPLVAAHGQEALELARSHAFRIDLLITDLVMPGISGRQLARELQQRRPELRVIFISGYSEEAMESDDLTSAGNIFLPKPFTAKALLNSISECLGN